MKLNMFLCFCIFMVGCATSKNANLKNASYSFSTVKLSENDSLKTLYLEKLIQKKFPWVALDKKGIYVFFDSGCECQPDFSFAFFDLSKSESKSRVNYCTLSVVQGNEHLDKCVSLELEDYMFNSFVQIPFTQMPKVIARYGNNSSNDVGFIRGFVIDNQGQKRIFSFVNLEKCLENHCLRTTPKPPVPCSLSDYVYMFDFGLYLSYIAAIHTETLPPGYVWEGIKRKKNCVE